VNNRLSPLISRKAATGSVRPRLTPWTLTQRQAEDNFENLKLFATGWFGGLIFFGTLFG
jgi:hypothetical protein